MLYRLLHIVVLLSFLLAYPVSACSVPVFRYALERWPADDYRVVIVHDGPLSLEQKAIVESLESVSRYENGKVNIRVFLADASSKEENEVAAFARKHRQDEPHIYLLYPYNSAVTDPVWRAPLTPESVKLVTESVFMKELTAEILRGESAVWVFLDSGDAGKDEKAYKVLQENLQRFQDEAELPEGLMTGDGEITGKDSGIKAEDVLPINQLGGSDVPLKISFVIQRFSRQQRKDEPVLLACILNQYPELKDSFNGPMAFPVFGKGRVLPPITEEQFTEEYVFEYASYLTGACSCQIKMQNPGIDLLSNRDWLAYIEGSEVVEDKKLPELSGTADLIAVQKPVSDTDLLQMNTEKVGGSLYLYMAIGIALLVVVALGSVFIIRKSSA